jgi:NADH-quinone oxidoreductase subunit J
MKNLEIVFFGLCTLFVLLGGVFTVAPKNPIRGAMGLLVSIIGIAGMYLMLAAELLAAIQVVVYAGAVVILFLFVIMLLGPSASEISQDARGATSRYAGAGVFALAAAAGLWVIMRMGGQVLTELPPAPAGMGTVELIGRELFDKQVVPFQIAGILLLIAVVGAMAVARGKHGTEMFLPSGTTRATTPPEKGPTSSAEAAHDAGSHGSSKAEVK